MASSRAHPRPMSLPTLVLAVLLPALPLDLTEAAQASSRPRECATSASTLWEKVREPGLRRYCDTLAQGFGALATRPEQARSLAHRASEISPSRAAPFVLSGRAEVALARYREGLEAFEEARTRDDRALDEPLALHAYARSLAHTGAVEGARAAYRALASRISLFPSAELRVRALLEGATVLMTPGTLDEASALLLRAQREPLRETQPRLFATLALVAERRGAADEAAALLKEAHRAGDLAAFDAFPVDDFGVGEGRAVRALFLEASAPKEAKALWEAYLRGAHLAGQVDGVDASKPLAGPPETFAAHARSRIESLKARLRGEASRR